MAVTEIKIHGLKEELEYEVGKNNVVAIHIYHNAQYIKITFNKEDSLSYRDIPFNAITFWDYATTERNTKARAY